MIEIDGSSGGGQMLRSALALSVFTQKPFHMTNIRKQRREAGLKAQHISCIDALQKISGAEVEGKQIGSTEILFIPHKIKRHTAIIDIGTAGSITLCLQALLLTPLTAEKRVKYTLYGGTDVAWSMTYDFFKEVIIPLLSPILSITISLAKRGLYPKGKGEVTITMKPQMMSPLQLDYSTKGELMSIKGVSFASKQWVLREVAEQQADFAKLHLGSLNVPIAIRHEYSETDSEGSGITLWAIYADRKHEISEESLRFGADQLALNNLTTKHVGNLVAQKLKDEIEGNATVDVHSADTLIPFIGIYGGMLTTSKITDHITSNIAVCEQFLGVSYIIEGTTIKVSKGYVE